ncbi:hypothetical protein [Flavobacterium sp. J27]|uniref:hypothetical protein n=1 Tax=Flavobacterium sp. J27 TaxID=2060419 RepID=UPI001030B978|nr:hypothetical protein [Flavobacterium sp. J27]
MTIKPTVKLDLILKKISEAPEFIASKDLFENVKNVIEGRELTPIVDKLFIDGYIDKKVLDKYNESQLTPPYYCRITYSGLIFLERGGYVEENNKIRLKNIWTKTKTLANIFYSILILLIAAAGVYFTIESKEKDKIIKQKNMQIKNLTIKLEKKAIINKNK